MKFGEFLVSSKIVTADNVQEALEMQRYKRYRLGRLLRELGYLSQSDLNKQLTLHLRPKNLESVAQAAEMLKQRKFPEFLPEWSSKNGVLAFSFESTAAVFISPCYRDEVIEAAENQFKRSCQLLLVDFEGFKFLKAASQGLAPHQALSITIEPKYTDDQKIAAADPYTSLLS